MKIAFIEPAIANVVPLGIAYLAQSLINNGHNARYFEAPRKNFLKKLKEFNPDILAFSIITGEHNICRDINSELRKHINAISLFGGPHCTFCPEFIESSDLIDGVCRGDGEDAMVELLDKIESGNDYAKTANWWLRANGNIYRNGMRQKIDNLDELPFPNREIIYSENPDLMDSPIKRLISSRGCPYACSYCFNNTYNTIYKNKGAVYRQRSPENIVCEIKEIKNKYPISFIKFTDDIFGLTMNYDEFAMLYRKEAGIPFLINTRPDLVSPEKVRLLKQAGCVAVTLAVESVNDTIRNRILNRNLPCSTLEKAILILKKEGIRIYTQNIIANPGETFEVAMETFNFNARHRVDFAECFLLTPYPGTEIYKYCTENNYFSGEVDTLQKSYWLNSPLNFDSEKEKRMLVNFQKFFSFGVQHPKAFPLIKLLIRLPPNKLFVFFNRLYDSWRINRVIRAKFTMWSFIITVRNQTRYIMSYLK